MLTQFAHRITALLGVGDTAARLGGDEFAVLCEDTEPHHVTSIAERLRAAAAEPFLINDTEIVLSVAVGSSQADVSPACVADPAALLREADRRMYETKRRTVGVPVPEPRGSTYSRRSDDQTTGHRSRSGQGASATPTESRSRG